MITISHAADTLIDALTYTQLRCLQLYARAANGCRMRTGCLLDSGCKVCLKARFDAAYPDAAVELQRSQQPVLDHLPGSHPASHMVSCIRIHVCITV